MAEERRSNPAPLDVAGGLAMLYTIGYLVMVGLLYFVAIPEANKEPLLQLFGLMSAIQMALISFYFGSSRNAEATSRALEQRQGRAEAVMHEIATKAAPGVISNAAPIPAKDVTVEAAGGVTVTGDKKP